MPDNPDLFRTEEDRQNGRRASALWRVLIDASVVIAVMVIAYFVALWFLTPSAGVEWTYTEFMRRL